MTAKKMFLNALFTAIVLSLTSCGAFAYYALPADDVRELNDAVRTSLRECNYDFVLSAHVQLAAGREPSKQWFDANASRCIERFERVIDLAEALEREAVHPRPRVSCQRTIKMAHREILKIEFLRACYEQTNDREANLDCFRAAHTL